MAQRLEAALRRPGRLTTRIGAPPVAPEAAARPRRDRCATRRPNAAPPVTPRRRRGFENLEDEMASLLGRPKTLREIGERTRVEFFSLQSDSRRIAGSIRRSRRISASISAGGDGGVTERAIQLIALLTVLSIAPSILIMMTSFTRIVVVLSLLRTALGTATAPPNSVIIALALFLTAFVMGPVLQKSYDDGIKPLVANQIARRGGAAARRRCRCAASCRRTCARRISNCSWTCRGEPPPATPDDMSLRILVPAFMISELKRAFEIGFLLFLPFLIIDLVVASVLMSMGMMMLPPVVVSLPFKLIFFVLVDGWSLVAGSLVQSYGG